MRPFRFFFTLFYVTLIPLLSSVFLHLSKYLIGIAVSNILSVVRHDLGHAVFPVISFSAPDELPALIDTQYGHSIIVINRITFLDIFLTAAFAE